jgi:Putative DNA-binding domain
MLTKRLSELSVADIFDLRGVAESRFLDFKSASVGASERDRREFVADVTAFANASGGDIVLGVATADGVASAVEGIELADADKEKLRLGDLIRSGTEPRLMQFDMVWIPTEGARGFLVIRVPRSWQAPHRVTLQGNDKFYVRNSAGKHPMNVDELRQAFTFSQTIVERIRGFRVERINVILSEEAPFDLIPGSLLAFHGVPLSSFVDPQNFNFTDYRITTLFPPLGGGSHDWQPTLEGLATHTSRNGNGIRAYTMLFRNGIIEGVAHLSKQNEKPPSLFLKVVETYMLYGLKSLLDVQSHFGIEPPYYVFNSILGVRGVGPFIPRTKENFMRDFSGRACRQDRLLLPELEISAERVTLPNVALLRETFDRLANAFGLPGSLSFDDKGNYV